MNLLTQISMGLLAHKYWQITHWYLHILCRIGNILTTRTIVPCITISSSIGTPISRTILSKTTTQTIFYVIIHFTIQIESCWTWQSLTTAFWTVVAFWTDVANYAICRSWGVTGLGTEVTYLWMTKKEQIE